MDKRFISIPLCKKQPWQFINRSCYFCILLLFAAALFTACGNGYEASEEPHMPAFVQDSPEMPVAEVETIGDDMPITRGMVAKIIALTFSDRQDIDNAIRRINFNDTNVSLWHDRYINTAVALGHLGGSGASFYPDSPLSLEQAQFILDRLDPNNPIRIQLTDANRRLAISYALWMNLYMQLLDNISGDNDLFEYFDIDQKDVIVLITPDFNAALPSGHIITNHGHFAASGIDFSGYLDKEVNVLHRDNEIIAILGITNTTPTIRNAFITGKTADSITIFAGGAQRTYEYDTASLPGGLIADIRIDGKKAEFVQVFTHTVNGIVKEIYDDAIEIEDTGVLPLHSSFSIYNLKGHPVTMGSHNQITIGYNAADFIVRDGQIAAAVILRHPMPEHVRVVLSTTGFAGRIHSAVELVNEAGFAIHTSAGIIDVPGGQVFRLSQTENTHLTDQGRITIIPNDSGRIAIPTIGRNWPDGAAPEYRGVLEITRRQNGFVIVNQLPLEEYLYAVIPSEMPASFGLESAKVQAITARSYAYNHFFANRFYMYGANMDDSIHSQVYNNFPETSISVLAVNETRGVVLAYAGSIISANFFSTSAGHTANSGDVWLNFATGELDAETPPYLTGRPQYLAANFGDLSIEANARSFFTTTDITAFDSHSPWFRWDVSLSHSDLTEIINRNLPALALASPNLFQIHSRTDFPPSISDGIGAFVSMEVISRGAGGNIRELHIIGQTASVTVITEYAIRRLLAPSTAEGIFLNRHNASPILNHFMLPSTFMVFDDFDGIVYIYGGGFGHGVGMSQNGVYGMVQLGYNYEQILSHFYPGTSLMSLTVSNAP